MRSRCLGRAGFDWRNESIQKLPWDALELEALNDTYNLIRIVKEVDVTGKCLLAAGMRLHLDPRMVSFTSLQTRG